MKYLFLTLTIALITFGANAQEFKQRSDKSPMDVAKTMIDDTYVKVTYCQPAKNDREVFGKLVPYGKVWRAGANESTEITTTKDIMIGGKKLAAGSYSIYAIPNEKSWTIIVNKALNQWGTYSYSEGQDLFRFDVPVTSVEGDALERFTVRFFKGTNGADADLVMAWDKTKVVVPVKKG